MWTITKAPNRHRRLVMLVVAFLGVALLGAVTTPADAAGSGAKKPTVTLTAPKNGVVGKALKIEALVTRGVTGQELTLQRRDGTTWITVVGKQLPAKGKQQKKVAFSIKPVAAGTEVYRATLAKKKKTDKAVSKSVTIQVDPAVEPEERLTLTTSTSTADEQTTVTFSGALADGPADAPVEIQYSWGPSPQAGAWQDAATVTATGGGASQVYEGTLVVPVPRNANTDGAPQLNVRALADGAVSPTRSYLLRTRFDGVYTMYRDGEISGQNSFVVIYSDRAWRMYFGAVEVRGTTDGWDLLDNSNLRFHATYHPPGQVCESESDCHGDEDYPWIEYVATWTGEGDADMRIEGLAVLQPT